MQPLTKRKISLSIKSTYIAGGFFAALIGVVIAGKDSERGDGQLFAMAYFFIFVVGIIINLMANMRHKHLLESGEKTIGTITKIVSNFWPINPKLIALWPIKLEIAYEFNNQHYKKVASFPISQNIFALNTFAVGDKIQLFVNPAIPKNFVIENRTNYRILA